MRIAGSPLGQPSLSRRRLGFYCHIFFCHPENNGTGLRRRAAGEGRGGRLRQIEGGPREREARTDIGMERLGGLDFFFSVMAGFDWD